MLQIAPINFGEGVNYVKSNLQSKKLPLVKEGVA